MKKLKNKIIATSAIAIIITAFNVNISNAVLESRPDSAPLINKSPSTFFSLIRKMETADGPLGLNATVSDDGTETSGSNDIDVHMIKNTEYGTVGMLGASVYGAKTSAGIYGETTTGNATGVYQMGTRKNGGEPVYVAGIYGEAKGDYIKNIKNAPQKYWDNYTSDRIPKPGDGTLEIGWVELKYWVSSNREIFKRWTSGVFTLVDPLANEDYSSRAVIVVGSGL